MKVVRWLSDNILFILTLFLLAFIPLYPKLPLVDIQHTWVYIRAEDFVVLLVILLWIILMLSKKVTLKTPLTLPIILFWIVGAISTIHAVILIFPRLSDVFPNVALLSYLRRIEYMSLFFVAYSGMKDKRLIPYVVSILTITLLLVFGYGIGQKFFGFPAYLTMNEEFAKGTPIRLSELSRIPSTFGGHYDLAAYLVLIIPLLASMVFGFKNWFVKLSLLITVSLGFVLLFMTVSRISFFVLALSIIMMLLFQKKKKIVLFSLSAITLVVLLLLSFSPSLLQRFGNTVKEVDVLIDAKTGDELGYVKEVEAKYFKDKVIKLKFFYNKNEINLVVQDEMEKAKIATTAGIILTSQLPSSMSLLIEPNTPTGENLPSGTGYINLPLSPIVKKTPEFLYENPKLPDNHTSTRAAEFFDFRGDFLIKRVLAYDLSFTTRFQGEWPRAIEAFQRNIILGSGYSSISLAVDNNYLRILGEVGFLGFALFIGIFFIIVIYIKKILPRINSPLERSFIIGFAAGLFGLALNAIFIDVFEASKIAYLLWLLTGITFGILNLYQKNDIDPYKEIKKALTSTYAIVIYLFIISIVLFSPIFRDYFIGDDFTWLRWAADRKSQSIISTFFNYFTDANGFFYSPGTKVYFLLMYSGFWLNQTVYYMVSIFLHFIVAMLLFLISKKILKDFILCVFAALTFLVLSGYSEAVFWISSTGHLFNAMFILLSLLFFIIWEEQKKNIYFLLSFFSIIFSLLFHELGVIAPLIIILYKFSFKERFNLDRLFKKSQNLILLSPILPYLILRYFASSHWFSGDYNYNLLKLPFNIVGNVIGYLTLALFGPFSLQFYQILRNFLKEYMLLGVLVSLVVIYIFIMIYRMVIRKMTEEEQKIVVFCFLFFMLALLPFLGLENITPRYSYLSSVGFILLFVIFIKKLYDYLLNINGRQIAFTATILVVFMFFLVHLIQLQKTEGDWYAASEKTKTFLISIEGIYADHWTKESAKLYFVNVPIRQGEAWMFPTGLKDILWFVFHNPKLQVYQLSSVNQALNMLNLSPNEKVLEFNEEGGLIERVKKQN